MPAPTFGTFFLPGPTEVRPEILHAMTRPMISHRGADFEALFARIQDGLRPVFRTRHPVLIGTCSATGLMEAGVRCAPAGRVLALVNGAFSDRFARIAEACGRAVERYEVAWGAVHDAAEVRRRLGDGGFAALTVVHSETSTGALNDVRAIAAAARAGGAVPLIDSVSGLGGAPVEFDAWGLDYLLTGSQKALALPPGLAFAVMSDRFLESARAAEGSAGRGVYFDLVEYAAAARKSQAPNTPAISLYYALDAQVAAIAAEGIEARWARHAAMRDRTIAWVGELRDRGIAIDVLAPEGHRSPTVTTVTLPQGVTSDRVVGAVRARGVTIGTGYGRLREGTIRIGHMGDHTVEGVERCLAVCGEVLAATV